MSDARERMIDAAVRAFGEDLERKESARKWLDDTAVLSDDDNAAETTERFDELDAHRKRLPWRRIYLVLAMVAAVCFFVAIDRIASEEVESLRLVQSIYGRGGSVPSLTGFNKLPPDAQRLLGDPGKLLHVRRKELWDSEPGNPAFFSEYAAAYHWQYKALPPDYFAIAARIDPENAWFDYFGAAVVGGDAVKRLPATKKDKEGKMPRDIGISDRPAYDEAMSIIRRAAEKRSFNSYENVMFAKRVALLPQSTPAELIASTAYLYGEITPYIRLIKLNDLFSAGLRELELNGDTEGFRQLAGEAKECVLKGSEDPVCTVVQEMVVRLIGGGISHQVSARAKSLGLEEEFAWAGEWHAWIGAAERAKKELGRNPNKAAAISDLKGSILVSMTAPMLARQTPNPPAITRQDLKPGRLRDYFWISMLLAATVAMILSVAAIAFFIYRFRSSKTGRILAERVERLLEPVDWVWIIGAGAVLPMLLVYFLMIFTPLGSWDTSIRHQMATWGVMQPVLSFAGLMLLLIITPVLLAGWRLRLRAAAFGFSGRNACGWISVSGLLIFCTAFDHVWPHWVSFGFGMLGVVWVIVMMSRSIFSGPARLLRRLTIARVMLPSFATSVVLLMTSVFAFLEARQYWHEQDGFSRLGVEEPSALAYECRLARKMRGELREMLYSNPGG